MHNYKELKVWQKSRELVKDIYIITAKFPKEETYGVTSQLRRAAVPIPLNTAEGSGRNSDKDFCHFLDMAFGSAMEVETLVILCLDLKFISDKEYNYLLERTIEVQKMLKGLNDKLRKKIN